MNKKELIRALEAKWGVKATFLGVPSCAYELKTETGSIVVDRYGVIRDQQGREVPTMIDGHIDPWIEKMLGTEAPTLTAEAGVSSQQPVDAQSYCVELPMDGHTGASLRNLVNMLASKRNLLAQALELTEPMMDERFAEELGQKTVDSVESFHVAITELGPERCPCLSLDLDRQTVAVKLKRTSWSCEEIEAFRDLAICLSENALRLKSTSYRPAQEENPKYALRTWLIRLGLNGDRFKETRKVLLAKLAGSSAFRSPKEGI